MNETYLKIAIVVGTRPEIIKMSPLIRECEDKNINFFVIHTGQHYTYELDKIFFEELDLPLPKYNLNVGSDSHAIQTGNILRGTEQILLNEKPDIVLVQGDTNTVLASSLAASKLNIKIGHIEAGLRSYDRTMPEEINRIIADSISDLLFAPTEKSKETLIKEGIPDNKIKVTGNTIVDAVKQNLEISSKKLNLLEDMNLTVNGYFLITMHRQENVDNKEKLGNILKGLDLIHEKYDYPLVFPIHPRTRKMITQFGFRLPDGLKVINPIGFLEFLQLESKAKMVITDSGGVQEESCILKVPCVTLRNNTERPETLDVGSNVLAGTEPYEILDKVSLMINNKKMWNNPFGQGNTGKIIINHIQSSDIFQ